MEYNTFILSIFSVGMSLGNIFFQDVTGRLLDSLVNLESSTLLGFDNFNSAYIIAHAFFLPSLLCFLTFVPVCLIYKRWVYLVKK